MISARRVRFPFLLCLSRDHTALISLQTPLSARENVLKTPIQRHLLGAEADAPNPCNPQKTPAAKESKEADHSVGVQEVPASNPGGPTISLQRLTPY
jgi:hypothetical protein